MKNFLIILSFICLESCARHEVKKVNCIYLSNDLFDKYDRVSFSIGKSRTENWTDVMDSAHGLEQKGLYQFDTNGRLRFYAFIYNDSNDYYFSEQYDSLGNIIGKTGTDVVRWFVEKHRIDSLSVTFMLYTIHNLYGKIRLKIGSDSFRNIRLFKSAHYSNLIGGGITIVRPKSGAETHIYLQGIKMNTCTRDSTLIRDSTLF